MKRKSKMVFNKQNIFKQELVNNLDSPLPCNALTSGGPHTQHGAEANAEALIFSKKLKKAIENIEFLINSAEKRFMFNRLTSTSPKSAKIQADLGNFDKLTDSDKIHKANEHILFLDSSLSLLRPREWYIKLLGDTLGIDRGECMAELQGFSKWLCKGSGKYVYFPVIKAGKYNPYKKICSARASASRRFKVIKFMEKITKKKVYLCDLVLTFPKRLSELLFDDPNGDEKAWNCITSFIEKYNSTLGYWINLHRWKSCFPFQPHYHFHLNYPNYYYDKESKKFKRIKPFLSSESITAIKKLWCECITESLNLNNTETVYGDVKNIVNAETINIFFKYKGDKGAQLHSLKYSTRSYLFDVADYFDACDTDNDDVRFAAYYPYLKKHFKKFAEKNCIENRTRVFGFLKDFVNIVKQYDLYYEWKRVEKTATCPICSMECECANHTDFNDFGDLKSLNVYIAVKSKYVKIGEMLKL